MFHVSMAIDPPTATAVTSAPSETKFLTNQAESSHGNTLFFLNLKMENKNTHFIVYNAKRIASLHHLLSCWQVLETSLHTQKVGGSFASSTLCSEYLCSASSWLVWAISWAAYSAKELAEWRKCLW